MKRIKLSDWCEQNGVSWQTGYRYWKNDKITGIQPNGYGSNVLIDVPDEEPTPEQNDGITVIYARVSSQEQAKPTLKHKHNE